MLPQAEDSKIDWQSLGARVKKRKEALMAKLMDGGRVLHVHRHHGPQKSLMKANMTEVNVRSAVCIHDADGGVVSAEPQVYWTMIEP